MKLWQLQEAKAKFSRLLKEAKQSPQTISVHGQEAAVLVSYEEYQKLVGQKPSLPQLMQNSPLYGLDIDLPRDSSSSRQVDL